MKKASIYIILFIYCFVQLRPLTAVLQDAFAHTFFKMQHMATVHYENGHYHLHNEVKTIAEQDNGSSAEKIPSSEKTETISSHLLQTFDFVFKSEDNSTVRFITSGPEAKSGFTKISSPPPKV